MFVWICCHIHLFPYLPASRSIDHVYVMKERVAQIDQELALEEQRQRQEAQVKVQQIESAERRRHGPVDDSQMVDEMFGFIDAQSDLPEGGAPTAFKVHRNVFYLLCTRNSVYLEVLLLIFRQNARHCNCISPIAIVRVCPYMCVCLWVCLCMCVYVCVYVCRYAALMDLTKIIIYNRVVHKMSSNNILSNVVCSS